LNSESGEAQSQSPEEAMAASSGDDQLFGGGEAVTAVKQAGLRREKMT